MTFWTLPVDDDKSVNFFISFVGENEAMPFEQRRKLELFGQYEDRPYAERQWIPGDHDAQVSQGPINVHALEHLGTQDRGIVMFRRFIRRGIQAVEKGQDPKGFYLRQEDVPPTFANDRVVKASEIGGDPDDPAVLRDFGDRVAEDYKRNPPMRTLYRDAAEPSAGCHERVAQGCGAVRARARLSAAGQSRRRAISRSIWSKATCLATDNICTHAFAFLSDGYVEGFEIVLSAAWRQLRRPHRRGQSAPCIEPIARLRVPGRERRCVWSRVMTVNDGPGAGCRLRCAC